MLSVVGLADDLTGALEIGALFDAPVSLVSKVRPGAARQVIDTETRHLPPQEAAERLAKLANRARDAGVELLYKKTDSTLRGNIVSEFEAVLAAFPGSRILYAPAYPAMGRTVRDGVLYVDGVLVGDTEFAKDPLNPIAGSRVPICPGVTVLDAGTDLEIDAAAHSLIEQQPPVLAAGPGAFARAIAGSKGLRSSGKPRVIHRALIVNGSMNEASSRQVSYAGASLPAGWRIVTDFHSSKTGMERAFEIGRHVDRAIRDIDADALIVFGGDTAFGIMTALGVETMNSPAELLPGIPISYVETSGRTLQVITKAGGFGGPDLLRRILNVVQ